MYHWLLLQLLDTCSLLQLLHVSVFPHTVVGHVFSATVITRIGVSPYSCWTRVLCYSYYTDRCFFIQLLDTCSLLQTYRSITVGHMCQCLRVQLSDVRVFTCAVVGRVCWCLRRQLSDIPVFTFTVFLTRVQVFSTTVIRRTAVYSYSCSTRVQVFPTTVTRRTGVYLYSC